MARFIHQTALALFLAGGLMSPALAQRPDEPRHCPDNPAGTFRIFEAPNSTESDKAKLISLSEIAKGSPSVCILAFIDPASAAYSKKLAIRGVKWALDTMTGHGVPRQMFAFEFRPAPPEMDKASMRHIEIILGR